MSDDKKNAYQITCMYCGKTYENKDITEMTKKAIEFISHYISKEEVNLLLICESCVVQASTRIILARPWALKYNEVKE